MKRKRSYFVTSGFVQNKYKHAVKDNGCLKTFYALNTYNYVIMYSIMLQTQQ